MAPVSTLPNQTHPTMLCASCRLPILVEPWIVEHVNPRNVFCGAHQPPPAVTGTGPLSATTTHAAGTSPPPCGNAAAPRGASTHWQPPPPAIGRASQRR